jgi:hypothetical protein
LRKKKISEANSNPENLNRTSSTLTTVDSINCMLKDDDYYSEDEMCKEIESIQLVNEKVFFLKIANDCRHFKEKSNASFWRKHSEFKNTFNKISFDFIQYSFIICLY